MPQRNVLTRRSFLSSAAMAAGAITFGCSQHKIATEPVRRGHWRLGLDTYTLHRSLTAKDPALRRDLFTVLADLPKYGLEGMQIDPSHFPGDDEATLAKLREITREHDLYIEFGMGGWDPQRMAERIELTSRFGGRALRTFFSDEHATWPQLKEWMGYAEEPFRRAGDVAEKHDVYIAIENHGDFTGPQLRDFLDRVNHPRVGNCFDTGNARFRREDPIECAEALAPYAYSMHLKDWTTWVGDDGEVHWREAVPGEGEIPMVEVLTIVAKHQPKLFAAVETPVAPGPDEAETVRREWKHFKSCAREGRRLLKEIGVA